MTRFDFDVLSSTFALSGFAVETGAAFALENEFSFTSFFATALGRKELRAIEDVVVGVLGVLVVVGMEDDR